MQILFIHQNFPGQYRYLARHFVDHPDWECYAIGQRNNLLVQAPAIHPNIILLAYDAPPAVAEGVHPHIDEFAAQVNRAQAISKVLLRQQKNGLNPDIICAHPGWGEGLYLRELFPKAKLLFFFEFYAESDGPVIDFEPEFPSSLSERMSFRIKNAQNLISLNMADAGVSPTRWQWQTFPAEYRDKIRVIHDGVDTSVVVPNSAARLRFPSSSCPEKVFSADDEIITFAVRNLEPSRGFHRFMRALPRLQKLRPKAHFVIIGGDQSSYVKGHASGKSWREVMLEEVGGDLDISRVFFLGRVPYKQLLDLFSITSLHIYMTIPFVLSWSMLEAMACCAPVLASSTQPVTEVIRDGENGFLFDYFSEQELVDQVARLMDDPELRRRVGVQAREFVVANYDLNSVCLPQQLALINELVGK